MPKGTAPSHAAACMCDDSGLHRTAACGLAPLLVFGGQFISTGFDSSKHAQTNSMHVHMYMLTWHLHACDMHPFKNVICTPCYAPLITPWQPPLHQQSSMHTCDSRRSSSLDLLPLSAFTLASNAATCRASDRLPSRSAAITSTASCMAACSQAYARTRHGMLKLYWMRHVETADAYCFLRAD